MISEAGPSFGPRQAGVRVWERHLDVAAGDVLDVPLRFRVVPGVWPEIEIAAPDGTRADIDAPMYELLIRCDPGPTGSLAIDVSDFALELQGRALTSERGTSVVPGSGPIELALVIDDAVAAVAVDGARPFVIRRRGRTESVEASPVTANVSGFRIAPRPPSNGRIVVGGGMRLLSATIFGLRPVESPLYRAAAAASSSPGATFYKTDGYLVSDGAVSDADDVPALVPDRRTIVSPIRVVEEFAWRETPYGDMTRIVDRTEMWRSRVEPGRFPELRSGFRSVDAAFELALETFQRNSSGEFSLPGETGLWSAGFFQGSGLGFGSWKRDTAHIALRGGNLIDRTVARASLAHVVSSGFDNGSDGDSLPAVAVWDHLLATGDETLVHETWPRLAASADSLDARFDERRGLVLAPQSTSNDLFEEPENGGYALSTEIYSMATYAALARMGSLEAVHDPRAPGWKARASVMQKAITSQYWNADHGYFTSGPVGTEAHAGGVWETSGAEAAVWGFLGAGAEKHIPGVLAGARRVAMSDYGMVLFPHRDDDNHFCNSVWYCWQAGIARAAARAGDADLVHRLIGQQVRTAVLHKTFYEVTDARTGASWRWPGQLWHAAGFVSLLLFGVFGIDYDLDGMTFRPAVAPEFDGVRLEGLPYRGALLDIEVRGHGSRCAVFLDGRRVERVAATRTGRHSVVLVMS